MTAALRKTFRRVQLSLVRETTDVPYHAGPMREPGEQEMMLAYHYAELKDSCDPVLGENQLREAHAQGRGGDAGGAACCERTRETRSPGSRRRVIPISASARLPS